MDLIRVLPIVVSMWLLAAHFFRAGLVWLAAVSVALPLLLVARHRWVARFLQTALVLGAIEWVRTLIVFASARAEAGQPWTRLAFILGTIALITLLSAAVFWSASLRARYGLDRRDR
jgi:hypothetical protein